GEARGEGSPEDSRRFHSQDRRPDQGKRSRDYGGLNDLSVARPASGTRMSELTRRILFGVVAAPLALVIVFAGGWALAALLAVGSAIAAWEFYRLARATGHAPLNDLGCALAGLLPLAVHARYLGFVEPRLAYLAVL